MILGACLLLANCQRGDNEPIKVGILHSLTGTMAISESPVIDATLLAIEEINANGGLLGRKLVPVVIDGKSDRATFAHEAERLITEEKVVVIFGCWTSASRKAVKPIVEKYRHLLLYPVQYEGAEQSPNIVYGGQSANQQIIPAIAWSMQHLGKRFFLVGSDYIFPHMANEIITTQLKTSGSNVVGEHYLQLGSSDVADVIEKIIASKPDVILNTINGDSNLAFFKALRAAGITSELTPTLSFSIGEPEAVQLGQLITGDYASWSYFQNLDNAENRAFLKRFKARFGEDRVLSDPMQAAYTNVQLWAASVTEVNNSKPEVVLNNIKYQHRNTATGIVFVNQENNHQWKTSRIGKIRRDGQFDLVWQSSYPVEPVPFPIYRTPYQWRDTVKKHYERWGGNWENPGPEKMQAAQQAAAAAGNQLAALQNNRAIVSLTVSSSDNIKSSQEIRAIESRWIDLPLDDQLLQHLLKRPAALSLKQFQRLHSRFSEIFITDMHGLTVAMTNKTSDYYQADEQWWIDTYANGAGKVWQGEIEYDESAAIWAIPLYRPLRDSSGKLVGIIKAVIEIGDFISRQDNKP